MKSFKEFQMNQQQNLNPNQQMPSDQSAVDPEIYEIKPALNRSLELFFRTLNSLTLSSTEAQQLTTLLNKEIEKATGLSQSRQKSAFLQSMKR